MVCVRCKMAVQAVFDNNNIAWTRIDMGRAELPGMITDLQKDAIQRGLQHYKLELMEDRKTALVERIKAEIISLLNAPEKLNLKLSAYLSDLFDYNYTYLSNLFSEQEEISLERFFIMQRVERVKELIVYEDMPITEIADTLHYSSVAHLSQQFKKVTGFTPANFRKSSREAAFTWRKV